MGYVIDKFFNFLNNSSWIITLLVGAFAFILYKKQKNDSKRDAARLIIQEVRYAEQLMKNAKDVNYEYSLANRILPTNNWHKNINLFINNLKESELDIISKFYSNAIYLDEIIKIISLSKNESKIIIFNDKEKSVEKTEENNKPQRVFYELGAQKILIQISQKIELIYNTPAVDKLRQIADRKWYQI